MSMSTHPAPPVGLTRRAALVAAPFAVGALVTSIAFLLLRDSFPDKIATHFTLDGAADGYSSPTTTLGQYMLLFVIEAVGTIAAGFSSRSALTTARSLAVFASGLSAATAYGLVAAMRAVGVSDGHGIQLPLYQLPVAIAVGVAAGAVVWLASRRRA
ncbi:DUF1648 domain-containing protein [Streptomyces sp. DSM 40907]|uniref:DUF1648 domain-containing protein n=1 Tax=Streptomyces kutzneri TaxID=3051179 RepID=UPI0028D6B7F5|nr:DUF1648 domain-containing protein [Streptomyces sp. DSM 40907]